MIILFSKYQGTGNDFVLLDNRDGAYSGLSATAIALLCDRRFGIGADGLMLLENAENADFRMIYFNADGNESTMCGNGGRCIALFAYHLGVPLRQSASSYQFVAIDGAHEAAIEGETVHLRMGSPQGLRQLSPSATWIDTGSPHYVLSAKQPVAEIDVFSDGRHIRHSPAFAAIGGTNVNFMNVLGENSLQIRTYERGVEAETLSCGTGATACAYVYLHERVSEGASATVSVQVAGGALSVAVKNFATASEEVWLIGAAQRVFTGVWAGEKV